MLIEHSAIYTPIFLYASIKYASVTIWNMDAKRVVMTSVTKYLFSSVTKCLRSLIQRVDKTIIKIMPTPIEIADTVLMVAARAGVRPRNMISTSIFLYFSSINCLL